MLMAFRATQEPTDAHLMPVLSEQLRIRRDSPQFCFHQVRASRRLAMDRMKAFLMHFCLMSATWGAILALVSRLTE